MGPVYDACDPQTLYDALQDLQLSEQLTGNEWMDVVGVCQAIKRLHPEVGGQAADYARFARRAERHV